MSIWFSSDFHFGHTNIAGPEISKWNKGYRDFKTLHDMNKTLTEAINKYVKAGDVLYFLGDFCFGGHKNTPAYRHSIVCQDMRVCKGNHDHKINLYADLFTSIGDTQTFTDSDGHTIFMSHYSHQVWEGSHKGHIHLFGHSHDSISGIGKSMDVGVDVAYRMFGEYRPFSLEEILKIMNKKEIAFLDHHDPKTNIR